MADGHLNKCKDCTKKDVEDRYNSLSSNPDFVSKERERGREKYAKYKYKSSNSAERDKVYKKKFPEKKAAAIAARYIRVQHGFQKHHWSYNEEHFKDVVPLSISDHSLLHTGVVYDQSIKMYRRVDTGELLATKESHESLLLELKGLKNRGLFLIVKFVEKDGKIHELR